MVEGCFTRSADGRESVNPFRYRAGGRLAGTAQQVWNRRWSRGGVV